MKYESVFVMKPDLLVNNRDELINKIVHIIEQSNGTINNIQKLGKRKLAYCIKKLHEGYYIQLQFNGNNKTVSLIEKFCKVNDSIIRFITIQDIPKHKLQPDTNINNKNKINKND
ncbi:MAG: 30S ribosomal protein S6 [Endomicrobium sp.]|jgi:small subunit ribosomal protein S6|nr:30S ribosomal protein S6 [Endomicrobium sp.]